MSRLLGLIKKEFIHFYRDPVAMLLILYFFTACIILCGYCFLYDVKHLRTVVYDINRTSTSRDLIQRFVSTEYFDLDSYAASMADVRKRLDSGKAKVSLIIPPEFSRCLAEGRPAPIQYLSDGSDANQAGQGMGYAKRIIGKYNQEIILERLNRQGAGVMHLPGLENKLRTLYNQELEGVYFVVLFHIVIAGLVGGLILASTAIVREKERGTIDQLQVTPIRLWEFLFAKTIAPVTIGLIATVFSFLTIYWFDVPCNGNPLDFFAFMVLFLISMTGIGILIGAICNNMLQAILLSFGVMFLGVPLSGSLAPMENLLPFLQKVGQIMPPYHLNIAASGIFQKGVGFSVLWPEALKLLGISAGLLAIGYFIAARQWNE